VKAKVNMGVFGAAPAIESLPKITGLKDDVAVATAIGAVGGGVQRLLCSTSFYFGAMAKAKGEEKYTFGPAWEGFYGKFYAASPLSADSKKNAKKDAVVYAAFAQLPWDTQELAGTIFDYPHGSQGQKASTIRKVIEKHADKPPTVDELKALLPKPKSTTKPAATTIKVKAASLLKSLKDIRDDKDYKSMWTAINSNAELRKRFDTAEAALVMFSDMAKTVTDLKVNKGKTKVKDDTANAALAAALKAKPEKGARTH
jgi:hypothetical protein